MAGKIILVDTSILIDYFRKSDKSKSKLISLTRAGYTFQICVITEYEIYSGATAAQEGYWKEFLDRFEVLNLDSAAANEAVKINKLLKVKSKQIAHSDLFIAAIAIANNLHLVTLNRKHFERIDGLTLID